MGADARLGSHLRVALAAALLLALCQIVGETLIIAARVHSFLLSPHVFFGAQMYDFCLKLFLLLPGAERWLTGGALDRFLPAGFAAKLAIGSALVVPNLLVAGLLGLVVGGLRFALGRAARLLPALGTLVAFGFTVHLVSWAFAIYIPKDLAVRAIIRNTGRVFIWEGTFIALTVLAAAGVAAGVIARLRPALGWAVSAGVVAAVGGLLALPPSLTAPSEAAVTHGLGAARARRPAIDNVILISIDSLRSDRLGCYGNQRNTSPTLDRLAREGVRFETVTSTTSWTTPSHMSMLTGRDVLAHGVITDSDELPAGVPTLAGTLQAAGFATKGIVSAPFVGSRYGFSRGFDDYDDRTIPAPTSFDAARDEPAPIVTDLATKWLREHDGKRFFLFLHYWDVHYDYIPPAPYNTMFDPDYTGSITGANFIDNKAVNRRMSRRDLDHIIALYDGEIRWVDDHIARLLTVLDERGLSERTAIIVTADHGDEFFEHGFKGHGRTLYREVVQVPLIIRAPGLPAGEVVAEPASLVDVTPTVLDIAGVGAPAGVDGESLVPAMIGNRLEPRPALYAWLCSLKQRTNCQAMQKSNVGTLIHLFQPLRLEFYAPTDHLQHKNLARSSQWPRAEQLALMRNKLESQWMEFRSVGGRRGTVTPDEATLRQLKSLGYVE